MVKFEQEKAGREKSNPSREKIHPLELKYGKEPKMKDEDLWNWH